MGEREKIKTGRVRVMNLAMYKSKEELWEAIQEEKKKLDIHNIDELQLIKIGRMHKYYNNWEIIKWLESIAE